LPAFPEGATAGELVIESGRRRASPGPATSACWWPTTCTPSPTPAVDSFGNIFTTFSGSRGPEGPGGGLQDRSQLHHEAVHQRAHECHRLAFDEQGMLYISSRYDGFVYQVTPNGNMSVYVEGMGVATGIAFDGEHNLYVGDRSGTIFKISPTARSSSSPPWNLPSPPTTWPSAPTAISTSPGPPPPASTRCTASRTTGEVETFYRGLGRPQGMAFDEEGRLYVAASIAGRKGVVRIDPDRRAELFLSGPGIVGLAFTPSRAMVVATTNAIYRVDVASRAGRSI
jgi:hypothetical protein